MKTKLGLFQLYCIVMQAQFGSAIISIANAVSEKSGTGGWVSCLLAGAANSVYVYMLWKLMMSAGDRNVFQYLMQRIGGFWGRVILTLCILLYALVLYIILANWLYTTELWAYPRTPEWFLMLTLFGVCIYLALQPFRVYARFAVFCTLFMPLFILLSGYMLKDWNPYHLLPVFEAGPLSILDGAFVALWGLTGAEIMLLLPGHYSNADKAKVLRTAMYASWTTTFFYAFCVFSSMALFGKEMIGFIREPLLYQMKAISLNVIERFDLIIISVWILFILTSFYSYFMLIVSSISAMLRQQREAPRSVTYLSGAILFALCLYQLTAEQLDQLQATTNLFAPIISFGLIGCMLLLLWLTGLKDKLGGKGAS
ncbi:GerAB/ArcD/ProY family transporter [Paenibacillus sp. JDR-2]|uniref:GerAB/ArcD/ProY family transporter n=1 Tax=Paenibacillus sp. (strain JDR-2) TaxID=324057 RepID=UPI000166683A|nr:GerAB/ArcD/ProY family transporter [Paenibacillus sp. JDR-2]ACT02190.1 spore germination protein [Paenibacillus sp. JDR-2]